MSDMFTLQIVPILGVAASLALLLGGALYMRKLMRQRLLRLEEALRVYNNANAALGRHVTTLQREVQDLRHRIAAPSRAQHQGSTSAPTASKRERNIARNRGPVADGEEFSEAELRLAQVLKSGLRNLRLN